MNITLQIADSTYQRLIAGNTRLRGSIGLISPTEGNFNEHAKYSPQPGNKYIKLRHGSASVGTTQVRMSLRQAGRDEHRAGTGHRGGKPAGQQLRG